MSLIRIDVDTDMTAADVNQALGQLSTGIDAGRTLASIARLFEKFVSGAYQAAVRLTTGAVKATGTVTFSSTGPTNDETMTVAGVTITAKTSATPGALEFTRSNTTNVNATNLAALINSHASFSGIVVATAADAVVTLTAVAPGTAGNSISLTESMTNTAVSGSGLLTGGTDASATAISKGR